MESQNVPSVQCSWEFSKGTTTEDVKAVDHGNSSVSTDRITFIIQSSPHTNVYVSFALSALENLHFTVLCHVKPVLWSHYLCHSTVDKMPNCSFPNFCAGGVKHLHTSVCTPVVFWAEDCLALLHIKKKKAVWNWNQTELQKFKVK